MSKKVNHLKLHLTISDWDTAQVRDWIERWVTLVEGDPHIQVELEESWEDIEDDMGGIYTSERKFISLTKEGGEI